MPICGTRFFSFRKRDYHLNQSPVSLNATIVEATKVSESEYKDFQARPFQELFFSFCKTLGQRIYAHQSSSSIALFPLKSKFLILFHFSSNSMELLRSYLSRVRIPEPTNRIYKQECCVSFETPVIINT